MQPWVAISGLLLLLTDAVVSYTQVIGVVGHSITLPCTYSTAPGVTTMCWGRGACPMSRCSDEVVWTNGSHVTVRKHPRYKLKGNILRGNVSLTIENVAQTDRGLYCCRVEHRGWFNDMKRTLSLEIKPAEVTSVPTSPSVFTSTSSTPAPTQNLKPETTSSSARQTAGTQPTGPRERSTRQPTDSPLYSCPTDGNGTVTQSSDGLWHSNQTHVLLAQNPWTTTSKGLYIGICVTAVVLFAVLVVVITKKYFCVRNKLEQLNMVCMNDPRTGALQSAAEVGIRAEDNIYIIEDNVYVMD
ncbi:hepatitis A virus cellular receptor 1 isoform X1 [Mustela nigripes]|uniref:Hepatitis A virus cellular receptor 1 isoform X1 n=1 Tax=Mustela putorius furo TaxID=9669 RepID=A0A8U0SNE2_MUSPF|nr:hepatitis A virus cellular receptor 1 isoform X1 [Mustela putorius furo]XP_059273219.1 hepatitis A virus cellular receptor 1 isoform X1 [Mustela nigripes]